MAVTFLANGLVVAIIGIVQLARRRTRGQGHRDRRTEAAETRHTRSKFDDLNDLRSTGALTREEFKLAAAHPCAQTTARGLLRTAPLR